MKILFAIYALLAVVSSCSDEGDEIQRKSLQAEAVYTNMLAVDGCSWHFSVASGDSTIDYAPSERSFAIIEEELGKIETVYNFIKVDIKYNLTGKKTGVKCGWATTQKMDEIEIIDIKQK